MKTSVGLNLLFRSRATGRPGLAFRSSERAFTMVEIAIALGVIGFALVAIIGILPSGLQVQRDNRAETIINQDATLWLNALRSGARGMDDLTNYVESIVVTNTLNPADTKIYTYRGLPYGFSSGEEVVGILCTQAGITNKETVANVWAISGAAAEKDIDPAGRELGFKYRMEVQIERATNFALPFSAHATNQTVLPQDLWPEPLETLFHVRVRLSYPLIGDAAPARRKSYRALVSRNVVSNDIAGTPNFFFVP